MANLTDKLAESMVDAGKAVLAKVDPRNDFNSIEFRIPDNGDYREDKKAVIRIGRDVCINASTPFLRGLLAGSLYGAIQAKASSHEAIEGALPIGILGGVLDLGIYLYRAVQRITAMIDDYNAMQKRDPYTRQVKIAACIQAHEDYKERYHLTVREITRRVVNLCNDRQKYSLSSIITGFKFDETEQTVVSELSRNVYDELSSRNRKYNEFLAAVSLYEDAAQIKASALGFAVGAPVGLIPLALTGNPLLAVLTLFICRSAFMSMSPQIAANMAGAKNPITDSGNRLVNLQKDAEEKLCSGYISN